MAGSQRKEKRRKKKIVGPTGVKWSFHQLV
jgi:hypothetical protein